MENWTGNLVELAKLMFSGSKMDAEDFLDDCNLKENKNNLLMQVTRLRKTNGEVP